MDPIEIRINAPLDPKEIELLRDYAQQARRPILLSHQKVHVQRSFKCAKCKKSFPVTQKAIAERQKGYGIVAWCFGCVCSQVSSWEHPWNTDKRPDFTVTLPAKLSLPTMYQIRGH